MEGRGFVIEKMRLEDLPQVLAIEQASFPTPFSENLFRMELNLDVARLYVVRQREQVIGYIDYWCLGPEMHVITIAAHPDFRRQGIGSFLIEFMFEDAKKNSVKQISLDVRASNNAAITLYGKFGFRQTGVRKRYYQDNEEDALVMTLQL